MSFFFFFSLFVFFPPPPPPPQCHLLVSAEHRQEWRRNCGNWEASTRTKRERALQVLGEVGAHSQCCHPCQGGKEKKKSHLWSAPVAVDRAACSTAPIKDQNFLSGFRDTTDVFVDPKGTVY